MARHQCVLVVDDDQSVRQLMAFLITRQGYDVLQAQDGAEALCVAERSRIDLLVTDIDMPGMSGWELIDILKRRGFIDRSLVVTGLGSDMSRHIPGFAVPVMCLPKPFTPEQLLTRVQALLAS